MGKYLIINGGSSSLKFSLYEKNGEDTKELFNGVVERIGINGSRCTYKENGQLKSDISDIPNHDVAVEVMKNTLINKNYIKSIDEIEAIGHRVLTGGEFYKDSVLIDSDVLEKFKSLIPLGQLHMPGEIDAIESMINTLPNVPQVAVLDTAFHQTIPMENYLYALPYEYYDKYKVRKYGFHGTSHKYITETVQEKIENGEIEKKSEDKGPNIIIAHLGNGASLDAVKNGESVDTTMGFTPLDGLIMGTRCGTIDASILEFLCQHENITIKELTSILNKHSGLQGISGISPDVRDLETARAEGNERAILAMKMFEKAIVKYIAQYYFELDGKVDAIVFTAGIGENNSIVRENVVNMLSNALDITLDKEANNNIGKSKAKSEGIIASGKTTVCVIPTDEEKMILKDTDRLSKSLRLGK